MMIDFTVECASPVVICDARGVSFKGDKRKLRGIMESKLLDYKTLFPRASEEIPGGRYGRKKSN